MSPLYLAYGHHNYAHYANVYHLSLFKLEEKNHGLPELLMNNCFSVSRYDVPGCRDGAKSQVGMIGFSLNLVAYHR